MQHTSYKHIVLSRETKIHVVENINSDRGWRTGYELLKAMRENDVTGVCFAMHFCNPGHTPIGKKRFQIINDLCMQSYNCKPILNLIFV